MAFIGRWNCIATVVISAALSLSKKPQPSDVWSIMKKLGHGQRCIDLEAKTIFGLNNQFVLDGDVKVVHLARQLEFLHGQQQ